MEENRRLRAPAERPYPLPSLNITASAIPRSQVVSNSPSQETISVFQEQPLPTFVLPVLTIHLIVRLPVRGPTTLHLFGTHLGKDVMHVERICKAEQVQTVAHDGILQASEPASPFDGGKPVLKGKLSL
jgi:hypothetical protein